MDRTEFIEKFVNASEELDEKHIMEVITRADDVGLKDGFPRGHENLIIDMEECAELSQEVSKYLRGKGDYYNLLQEMADVYVILHHLQGLYEIPQSHLNKAINVKINRCEKRCEEAENTPVEI